MKKAKLVVLLMFLFSGFFILEAQQNRFDYNNSEVRKIRYAAREAGTLIASSASPYSQEDLLRTAARISRLSQSNLLSSQAESVLENFSQLFKIKSFTFSQNDDLFKFSLGTSVSFEAYPNIFKNSSLESPWSWSERKAAIAFPLEISFSDFLYGKTSYEIREDHNSIETAVEELNWCNFPELLDYIDWTFPFEGFLSLEKNGLFASIGRDKLRWGSGITSPLLLSDSPDFYDYLDVGFVLEHLNYHFLQLNLDATVTAEEEARSDLNGKSYLKEKNMFVHRLEFFFFDRFAFTIAEGTMLGGVEPDIRYYNPFIVFHNIFGWNENLFDSSAENNFKSAASIASLEFRFNPWRYFELSGSFATNQFQTSYEDSRYVNSSNIIPNAYAYQLSLEGSYPLLGGWLNASFEYVFVNPWMYIRENRLNSFTWRRRLTSNVVPAPGFSQLTDSCIGYPYGPDSIVCYASIGWDLPGNLTFNFSYENLQKGEKTISDFAEESKEATELQTPSGAKNVYNTLLLECSWFPLSFLELYGAVSWTISESLDTLCGFSFIYKF